MLPLRCTPSTEKRSPLIIGSLLVLLVPGVAGTCYLSSWNPVISLSALTLTVVAAFALIRRRLRPRSDHRQGPALEALRLSEERYRTLIDTLDVSLCRWLPDTTLVFTNDKYRKIFGIDDETAQPQWLSFLPESARESTAAFYQELIRSPRSIAYEHPVRVKDGTLRYYQWIDTPVLDAQGRVVEFESVGIDITERKQAEELIAAQRDLARIGNTVSSCEEAWPLCLAIVLRVSGMDCGGIYLFDGEHQALELVYHQGLSECFIREVLRYTTDTPNVQILLAGKPVYLAADVLSQEDLYNDEQLSTAATLPIHYQGRVLGAVNFGSHTLTSVPVFARHALETIAPEIGNLIVYLRTASSLRESEEKYRSLVDSQESALSTLDAHGVFHFINHIGAAPLALSSDQVVGRSLHDFFPPQSADKQLEIVRHVIATGQGMVTEVEHEITGEPRWYHVSIQPLRDAAGTVTLAMVNSRDVTEQKQAAQAQLHYSQQLASVVDIEHALAATLDQESIYAILAEGAQRLFPDVATVLVSRFDAERGRIRAVYGSQDGELVDVACLPELRLAPPGQGTQSQVIRTRQPLIISADLKAHFRTTNPLRIGSEDKDTQSALYVPMVARDSALGLIQLQSYAPNRFTEEDVRLLALVANTAAGAIQNADLYQELLELNRTLEERVRQRTAEVRDLYEHAPVGYHSLDASGALIMVNETQLSRLGYAREELIGRPFQDLLTPASQITFQTNFPIFKQRGWVRDLEIELVHKDGTSIPVLLSATSLYDEQGSFVMSRSSVFDNTERKKAETALRESEEQNRLLIEESPDAVVLFDASGAVVRMNRAFELLTGYAAEQIAGQSLDYLGLIPPEHTERLSAAVVQALQWDDRFAVAEFQITRATGERREVGARVFGLKLHGQQHYLTTMRDITSEKQVEVTLRHANAELARAARAKDEFLATMSHELRTPLNAILALSEILLEQLRGPLNERQQDALRTVEASGHHLLALINDILDLSKVEAGQLELTIEPVAIAEVCQASLVFVKEMAVKKAVALGFQLNDLRATLAADPRRMKQILVNLLSNAVKFTPSGGQVSLEVTVDAEGGLARFAVQDTGIGIAPDDLARLFQPFSQLDSSLTRQHEGTGLGLALVRRLAELHGGSILVESEPGKGSRFTLVLPCRPPETAHARPAEGPLAVPGAEADLSPAPQPGPEPAKARVLLAEDNEANISAIDDYLQAKGYEVIIARNGLEALRLIGEVRPDVILMDIQMPELDGLEVIRRVRASPDGTATPIIALTALAMPGDRERCLEAGTSEYMTKPISLRGLTAAIERLLDAGKG